MSESELARKLFQAEISKRPLKPEFQEGDTPTIIRNAIYEGVTAKCDLAIDEAGAVVPVQKGDPSLFIFEKNKRQSLEDFLRPYSRYFVQPEEQPKPPAQTPANTLDEIKNLPPGLRAMRYRQMDIW